MMPANKVELISIDAATTPENRARVIKDNYWPVIDGCVIGYKQYDKSFKEQCNPNEIIANKVSELLYPYADVQLIPLVYWRW